jgi:hypothetical protein
MENTDLNKLSFDIEAAVKIKKFTSGLMLIESNNWEFFDKRISIFNRKDRLDNHYIISTNSTGITFTFCEDSTLDESIREKCRNLFEEIFTNQN